jgi:hypothetical protein
MSQRLLLMIEISSRPCLSHANYVILFLAWRDIIPSRVNNFMEFGGLNSFQIRVARFLKAPRYPFYHITTCVLLLAISLIVREPSITTLPSVYYIQWFEFFRLKTFLRFKPCSAP